MKIIKYQCGCIGVRFEGQIDASIFIDCPTMKEGVAHAIVIAGVEFFAHLDEVTQADYGHCIVKLMVDGRQMRMVRALISGELT